MFPTLSEAAEQYIKEAIEEKEAKSGVQFPGLNAKIGCILAYLRARELCAQEHGEMPEPGQGNPPTPEQITCFLTAEANFQACFFGGGGGQ